MADPAVSPFLESAAVGLLVSAGPPLDQLRAGQALPADADPWDLWLIHQTVVARANAIRKSELSAAHGIEWIPLPPEVTDGA